LRDSPKNYLLPDEVYGMMRPLMNVIAMSGGQLPSSMPALSLEDIDADPNEAQRILKRYRDNLPDYSKSGNVNLNFVEQWETPPLSTEMRIMGTKIDNTKEQVVNSIKTVASWAKPTMK